MGMIMGVYSSDDIDAAETVYIGMAPLTHRRREKTIILSSDGKRFYGFDEEGNRLYPYTENRKVFSGNSAVGQICYRHEELKPYYFSKISDLGEVSIAFDGKLLNTEELLNIVFGINGKGPERAISEWREQYREEIIIGHLLSLNGKNLSESVKNLKHLKGSFNIIIMTNNGIAVIRDPEGTKPFCMGKTDNVYAFSPETLSLDMIDALYSEDIKPGHAYVFERSENVRSSSRKKNDFDVLRLFRKRKPQHCIREFQFYSNEGSFIFDGTSVRKFREKSGKKLAEKYGYLMNGFDIVLVNSGGVSESFSEESGIKWLDGLTKHYSIGQGLDRKMTDEEKREHLKRKYSAKKEIVKGKKVVLVEDSAINGLRLGAKVNALKRAGAKEISVLIGSPPIKKGCKYNRFEDFSTEREIEEMLREYDSKMKGPYFLELEDINDILRELGKEPQHFCSYCFR